LHSLNHGFDTIENHNSASLVLALQASRAGADIELLTIVESQMLRASYRSVTVIFLYKIVKKTGFNVAENGAKFTKGCFAEKNAKMRGVGYLADWQPLSSYSCLAGAPSFSKRYIRMKKSQCLFFMRSLFLSKSKAF